MPDSLLPSPVPPSAIGSHIDFDGLLQEYAHQSAHARLQCQGVSALWHLLGQKRHAYLADEVGMGKTRQAMGLIACQFLSDPNSHVVIVCPGKTLQVQWEKEWNAFIRSCYKTNDNRLKSSRDGSAVQRLALHERLRDFAQALLMNESRIHLLRYSSFSRPIWFGKGPDSGFAAQVADVIKTYRRCLREIGIPGPSVEEERIFDAFRHKATADWRQEMTRLLNEAYAKRVGELLKAREIDLVVFDEAQYLRHVDNQQNTNARHVFRAKVAKWLFMSATPLHSGVHDVKSLDSYLCTTQGGPDIANVCPACDSGHCTRASHSLHNKEDVVQLLKRFLVRRNRVYRDADHDPHNKVAYRNYRRTCVSMSDDPFTALTMGLVQKRLVAALKGGNNKFRLGECSSFESLSASVKRRQRDEDGVDSTEKEFDGDQYSSKEEAQAPDRMSIDLLNKSFRATLVENRDESVASGSAKYNMPHAKLAMSARRLLETSLADGTNHKSLVFVRRLDTVDELLRLLLAKFQDEVDQRVDTWRSFLLQGEGLELAQEVWKSGQFWTWKRRDEDDTEEDDLAAADGGSEAPELPDAGSLAYFEAMKRSRDKESANGLLASFHSSLLPTAPLNKNPLKGAFVTRIVDPIGKMEGSAATEIAWREADEFWERLMELVLGKSRSDLQREGSPYHWVFTRETDKSEQFWKLATLKRCLIQSLRQTDFIVDLYVLHRYIKKADSSQRQGVATLQEKLLWFLGEKRSVQFPDKLERYVANWREKLALWITHFDLVVDKCLRKEGANDWRSLHDGVYAVFARMSPVFGRSGRLTDENAVTQFKFPTHPNVLVSTDVLKEGVDLHLFCDEVIHYGVAWTSGDLEQRIGRVDRFGSMVSRRIGRHRKGEGNGPLPKLEVEFPYLDGTLDRFQVERVILEKMKSDLRMDLGKRGDELGIISLDDIDGNRTCGGQTGEADVPASFHFYPEDAPEDSGQESVLAEKSGQLPQALCPSPLMITAPCTSVSHLASLGCLVVRRTPSDIALADTALLRLCSGKGGRGKNTITLLEEFLIPETLLPEHKIPRIEDFGSVVSSLAVGAPTGFGNLHGWGFTYSDDWKTMFHEVEITNPFDSVLRTQVVLLEEIVGFWLLRTPLFATPDDPQAGQLGSETWMSECNGERSWGYLAEDQGIVWFLAWLPARRELLESGAVLELAERVGKTGDRLQHLHLAADEPLEWDYRSRRTFDAILSSVSMLQEALLDQKRKGRSIMSVGNENLHGCAELLADLDSWLQVVFVKVLAALDDAGGGEGRLKVSPVTVLPGGVLHLQASGRGWYRVQVFLQLKAGPEDGSACHPAPRLIWEVVAVPPDPGKSKPSLGLSDWDELPHLSPDGWEGVEGENCSVHVCYHEGHRYIALYHHPGAWDTSCQKMLTAWRNVLPKMQGGNFMRKMCQDLLLNACSIQ